MNALNDIALDVARRAGWAVENLKSYRQRLTATLMRPGHDAVTVVLRVTSNWNVLASVDMETGEFSGHAGASHVLFASRNTKDNKVAVYLVPVKAMEEAFAAPELTWMTQGKFRTSTLYMNDHGDGENPRYGFERKWMAFKLGEDGASGVADVTAKTGVSGAADVIARAKAMVAEYYGVSVSAVTINVAL